jgi:4-hydroxybenzoate polyprenyltransferase
MVSILNWTKNQIKFAHDIFKLEDQAANLLSFFVGATLAYGSLPPFSIQLIYGIVAVSFCLLGTNLINQIADIEIDRINKPHRPLTSGKMSIKTATIITWLLYTGAVVASILASSMMLILTSIYIFLGVGYSLRPLRFKDKFFISNLTIAIWYNFINFLIGWVVFKPAQTAPYALLFLLFFYDIIAINSKDYPDVEGDRQYGAKTLPVLIGIEKALRLDLIIQVGVQASFILLALNGNIPQYMAIMGGFLLLSTAIMFYYVEKTREYMNFYYMAFAMHVVMRIAVVVLFFLGHLKF